MDSCRHSNKCCWSDSAKFPFLEWRMSSTVLIEHKSDMGYVERQAKPKCRPTYNHIDGKRTERAGSL